MPEDYGPTCIATLGKLDDTYAPFAQKIIENGWVNPKNKTIFNNKAISDHFAIIPTGTLPKALKEAEAKVYDCVVRRFMAVFFPPAEFAVTTRWSKQEKFSFKTEGKVLLKAGWMEVTRKSATAKEELPALVAEDENRATGLEFQSEADETRPPARFTEATLLASMEHAGQRVEDEALAEAMKERGLGTPATRAQIIENLIATKYLDRHEKELLPTAKAEQLLSFLKAVCAEELASPALTGEWEYRLNRIQNGALSRTEFMEGIKTMTSKLVEKIINFQESEASQTTADLISPTDGQPMTETFRSFQSQDGEVTIYKIIGGRTMTVEELQTLLTHKKIGPLEGFVSKFGKNFSASLILDENWKVKFDFSAVDASIEPVDITNAPKVGTCPLCKGTVYATEHRFVCEHSSYVNKDAEKPCSFHAARSMLGVYLSDDHMKQLLQNGKTELIEGFVSKRTRKSFSAYLILKPNGGIGFEFPPREKAEKKEA